MWGTEQNALTVMSTMLSTETVKPPGERYL